MANVAIIYHSLTGTVHRVAAEMAAALDADGAQVRLRRVPALSGGPDLVRPGSLEHELVSADVPVVDLDDLLWADAVLIGSPTRFGMPSAEILRFIDTTAAMSIEGSLEFLAVGAFTSACATNGGQVTTLTGIHNAVGHWGAVCVTTGSREPILLSADNGNPYGVGNISRNVPTQVPHDTLVAARFLALRTAQVGSALASLRTRPDSYLERSSS
jgi:NAD(P)H dehydrogenase (quinone)